MNTGFPASLPDFVRHCAKLYGEAPCLTSRERLRTRTLTYRDLEQASAAMAAALVGEHGLLKGQCVLLIAPSGIRTVAALFGLFRAGVVAVPLDLNATDEFLEAVCRKTQAVAVIAPRSARVATRLPVIAIEDLPLAANDAPQMPEPGHDDIAEIVFTSGTTGDPKGVVLTHGNILSDVRGVSGVVPPGEAMRLVSILPLSHMYEQTVGLFLPMLMGGTVHYTPSLKPSAILAETRRFRVTGMVVVPGFLELLRGAADDRARSGGMGGLWALQHQIAPHLPMALRRLLFLPMHRAFGGRLRYFLCGGAGLPAELMKAWERTGIRVIEGYGATECAPVILTNGFDDRVPGSAGRPLEGTEVRLSDEGELQVRGPNVFGGYWNDPERTNAAFTPDGWYRTDDIAEEMPGHRFRIVGRLSERIVLPSGMNVFPVDVERELACQPEVRECAVLGVPDKKGERLHAVIRLEDGNAEADAARALDRANAALASHQRITGFSLWQGDFPKTALGKIKRRALRPGEDEDTDGASGADPAAPTDKIARILQRVTRSGGAFSPEMRLDTDLGIDSLGRVELAAEIERQTGLEMPEDAIAGLATVADLALLLSHPVPTAQSVNLANWPRTAAACVARALLQPLLLFLPHHVFARPFTVTGQEAFASAKGPILFVANHASHADTVSILRALPAGLRRKTAVAAAADYFFARRIAALFAAAVLGAFPFSREGRVRESLGHCGLLADEGWSILIYPEGTRSPDGRLLPFKAGIGLLARGLDLPVVPIAVTGGARLLRKGATWPRRAPVSVRFGAPVVTPPKMPPEEARALLEARVAELLDMEETLRNGGPNNG
ncbi:AMP-binding protein [Aestuariicoccus sp. MJ-SS9]|uniref:AMP-binding protein n=1 Tax=Aestuariicoccus sp. MJ-SS9 TaxID=3079855 RepID=UPI00290B66ED|nr:AMP-binding protein [Aestuariicoccus sp. MJ-SS9]MDU8911433.1 AMP-binding protein [Aestuariicoccus sp. MJ-SS9]